jgi:hypothetical protein
MNSMLLRNIRGGGVASPGLHEPLVSAWYHLYRYELLVLFEKPQLTLKAEVAQVLTRNFTKYDRPTKQ